MTFLQRIAAPALIALAINASLFVAIAVCNPQYLRDESRIQNPDATHYIIQGRNLWQHGVFSRCAAPPFVPDMLRTPGFPVLAGAAYWLGGVTGIFLVCVALHVASCILLTEFTSRLFGAKTGIVAGCLLASDLMVASHNFSGMADTPFLAPLLASLLLIVPECFGNHSAAPRFGRIAGGGLFLGVAALVRPTALYLGVLMALVVLMQAVWRGNFNRRIAVATCIGGPVLFLVGPWIARNHFVFGVPKLTTVDTTNLVYFVGAGAYQLHHDVSLEEAQTLIQKEYGLPSYSEAQNHWHARHTVAEMERQLHSAVPRVLVRYPRELAEASMLAISKASVSHSMSYIAELTGTTWINPGMMSLMRGDPTFWNRLLQNNPGLLAALAWQMLHTMLALSAGILGILAALCKKHTRPQTILLLFLMAYLYATVAMFGLEAFYRCRIPVLPLVYVFAAVGCCWLAATQRKLLTRITVIKGPTSAPEAL